MDYKKCGSCGCFKSIEEIGCRKSGITYKCCKKCRNKNINSTEIEINTDIGIKKDPELKEDGIVKIKDIEYEVKGKILDRDRARELIPNFDNLKDMPDENVVIPDECFKYVLGAKKVVTPEMMEKLGIRITSADDEDNNIYPDETPFKMPENISPPVRKNPVWTPDSSSSEEND